MNRMSETEKPKQLPDPELSPTREQLRAFASRRWDLVADEKLSFLATRYRVSGAEASRKAAEAMAQRWASLHPGSPSPEARQQDFQHHVALKRKLDRAADAIGRR